MSTTKIICVSFEADDKDDTTGEQIKIRGLIVSTISKARNVITIFTNIQQELLRAEKENALNSEDCIWQIIMKEM